MGSSGSITVECAKCGKHFTDWWRPCANFDADPELADPGSVECAATATCPHCGAAVRLGTLDVAWRR